MILFKKLGATLIIFILIFSLFSFLINPDITQAQPEDGNLGELLLEVFQLLGDTNFDNILTPHPFRYVGVWKSNDTRIIKGDMDFTLYFSSTILNQLEFLDYQDKINVGVYHFQKNSKTAEKIKEKKELTLGMGSLDERIQRLPVKIENLDVSLKNGDYLLFAIQINQTKKPISKITEKRFETKLMPRLQRISDLLKKSSEPELKEFGNIIDMLLENITMLDLGGEEIGSFVNVIFSSAFFYGSTSYDSRVKFSSEAGENFTLYFRGEGDFEFESLLSGESLIQGYFKIANQTALNSDIPHAWPPVAVDIENIPTDFSMESPSDLTSLSDFENWIILWGLYTLKAPPRAKDNVVTLYLKNDFKMSPNEPDGETIREKLSKKSSSVWISPPINRNRIIQNISAELYIHFPKLITIGDIKIKASLIDEQNNKIIANDTKSIDRTNLYELLSRGPEVPTEFNFDEFKGDEEIFYGHNLSLEVTVAKKPFLSLRPIKLLYNSEQYPSHVTYIYNETDHIKIQEFEDKKDIYAGGSTEFDINISSDHADKLNIDVGKSNQIGEWNVTWNPKTVDVESNSSTIVTVTVKSNAKDESAYENEDQIFLFFNVTGNTGIDSNKASVYVKETAVEYDIDLITPKEIKIKHGEEKTYEFVIRNKNTGFLTDSYGINVSSEKGLYNYYYYAEDIPVYNNESQNERIVNITIKIPWYTDVPKDKMIIEVISGESKDNANKTSWIYKVDTTITTPNIFENIYHLFEQISKKIGLDDELGHTGTWLLIGLFSVIILVLLLAIILIIKRKFATLVCLERIKEIKSDEKADFEITLKNPYKRGLTYDIDLKADDEVKERWDIELERNQISLGSGESDIIRFTVKPTDYVKPDDYAEIKVIVKPVNKNKKSEIDTITVLKDSNVDVKISGVIHWPKIFKKGDKVESSFKLFNRGNVSAENLSVILLVNGKEKNKIENVTIPSGGYADIKIPWIAEKGKNEVEIIVK